MGGIIECERCAIIVAIAKLSLAVELTSPFARKLEQEHLSRLIYHRQTMLGKKYVQRQYVVNMKTVLLNNSYFPTIPLTTNVMFGGVMLFQQ